jgi:hypothetical protein
MAQGAFPSISVSMPNTPSSGWFTSGITVTFTVPAGATPGGNCFQVGANSFPVSQQGLTTLACTATNSEGTDSKSVNVRIDSVAPTVTGGSPTRGPDQAGWYNAPVALSGGGSDPSPGSGLAGCSGNTYSGPDSTSATGTITCTDNAGNSASAASSAFKYDNTGPQITGASFGRPADANGWYNHAVAVNFTANDNLSGLAGCQTVTYAGPDGGPATVPGGCSDVAGNPASGGASINYDSTGPSVSGSPDRGPDSNGWYGRPVGVNFSGSDNASGVASCSGGVTYSGPDGMGSASGSCSDNAGNTGSGAVQIPYDATAPTVKDLVTARPADAAGWFNHAVGVTFTGEDAGSGIESCSSLTYSGPDNASAQVTGTCRDKAGHDSAPKAFRLKYDATPPSLSTVIAQVGNKFALLKWKISTDVASVRVIRKPGRNGEAESVIYSGKADFYKDTGIDNRAKYEYRVSAADEAANNTTEVTADAMPLPPLYNPAAGARVKTPVVFEWLSVEKATYYNLQVWCGKRKVLTSWPKKPRLVVPRKGKFAGRAYTLPKVGTLCRWYVWPGFGRFADRRYGKLAGQSTFRLTR